MTWQNKDKLKDETEVSLSLFRFFIELIVNSGKLECTQSNDHALYTLPKIFNTMFTFVDE